jgi:hypothetical protein
VKLIDPTIKIVKKFFPLKAFEEFVDEFSITFEWINGRIRERKNVFLSK